MLNPYLMIGEIVKPQGVRGGLKVKPVTYDLSRFEQLERVFVKKGESYAPIGVQIDRIESGAVYLTMEGVDDRNAAESLRGTLLYVDRQSAVELPEDAEFICDLIGVHATDDSGRDIGELIDVLQPGPTDVYVFRGPLGQVLVPALKSAVLAVDVRSKTMLLSAARLSEVAVFED